MAPEIMTSIIKIHLPIFQLQLGKPFKMCLPPTFLYFLETHQIIWKENMESEASKPQQKKDYTWSDSTGPPSALD